MVLAVASLGLPVSENVALRWEDFEFNARSVTVQRAFTHVEMKDAKTDASKATVPLPAALLESLQAWRGDKTEGWVFPSPVTGRSWIARTTSDLSMAFSSLSSLSRRARSTCRPLNSLCQ
jgi:integrase